MMQVMEIGAAVLGWAGTVAPIEPVVTTSWSQASVLGVEEEVDRMARDEHVWHDDAEVQQVLHWVHGHTRPGAPAHAHQHVQLSIQPGFRDHGAAEHYCAHGLTFLWWR